MPVLLLPGFLSGAQQYKQLAVLLRERGHPTDVVPVAAWEWGSTLLGGSFTWYLRRAAAALDEMQRRHQGRKVCLVSAGGAVRAGGRPRQRAGARA
jgi:broad specificity phosphatase PhoE